MPGLSKSENLHQMPNIVIAGAQWGDEGKGKIVDLLCEKVQVVARYNGGHNAGHTVLIGEEKYVLHLIPSGILRPGLICVLGNGMVIDPSALQKEIEELRGQGVVIEDNLVVSDRAHVILPHHRALEALAEELRGDRKLGTTLRGIGPAYEDKVGRRGIRVTDLLRPERLPEKLTEARRHYEQIFKGSGREPEIDWEQVVSDLAGHGEWMRPLIGDASAVLQREAAAGYSMLFEGAQATLLDVDLGTYPYVSSSTAAAGGAGAGLGIPPTWIDGTLGVIKAYTTRVGTGPFPTELLGPLGEEIRERGFEYGASTGRPRRCGWFDAVLGRYAVRANGFDALALTKLDVLDGQRELRICTGYRIGEEELPGFPADLFVLEDVEPVYETVEGWTEPTSGATDYAMLPAAARRYVERLSELVGCEIGIVSTGPERSQTLFRRKSAITNWFE